VKTAVGVGNDGQEWMNKTRSYYGTSSLGNGEIYIPCEPTSPLSS